jgi:hypothetical protein
VKTYVGDKKLYSTTVIVRDGEDRARLYYLTPDTSQRLFSYSPYGFDWGSPDSRGTVQLSLAILLDLLIDPVDALKHTHKLRRLIEGLPEAWTLKEADILAEIRKSELEAV